MAANPREYYYVRHYGWDNSIVYGPYLLEEAEFWAGGDPIFKLVKGDPAFAVYSDGEEPKD